MAKQTINTGSTPNKGDGDPLRTAFDKINNNFDELYAGQNTDPSNTAADLIPDADGTRSLGSEDKRWEDVYVKDFIYLNQNRIELTANGTLLINGGPPAERQDTTGSVFADDSSVMVDGIAGKVVGPVDTTTVDANTITATSISGDLTGNVTGNVTGDIVGSVFADDSTSMVDSVGKAINLDGTVKGNIIPDANEAYDIGSMTHKFRDLYLSGSTINLGGVEITNDGGVITFGGEKVVVEGGTGDIQGSVFGDDSTLLVDAVNSVIPKAVVQDSTNWDTAYAWGDHAAAGYLVQADILDGTLTIDVNNTGDLQGSVFGDDSTLLVDAINSVIPKANVESSTDWDTAFGWGDHSAAGYAPQATTYTKAEVDTAISAPRDLKGSVFADDSTLLVDAVNSIIPKANIEDSANWDTAFGWGDHASAGYADGTNEANWDAAFSWGDHASAGYQVAGASHDGDIKGSVFGDDSTVLVDGNNNKVVGDIQTSSLRTSDSEISLGGPTLDRNQGTSAVAIGENAGQTGQEAFAVAVGKYTGNISQGTKAAAFGISAGYRNQGESAVAIGDAAGAFEQGANAIAIGHEAGKTSQAANSIVINATGSAVDNDRANSLVITPIRNAGGTHALEYDPATGEVTYDTLGGGGSGLQSRGGVTGTTSSLADAAQADLDITGFKSYALLTITTDRAARVRLYVSAATRTADASRAEGVDPTSDAGLIAEVITTGAETVIISPGAYGFNLESSPTTNIPCRVTNKSGGASTVQVDLNVLQLEA